MRRSGYQRWKEWADDNRAVFHVAIVISLMVLSCYGSLRHAHKVDMLKHHHKVVEGTVMGFSLPKSPGVKLLYYFYVDGKLYQHEQVVEGLSTLRCRLLIDKRLPVVYEEGDIDNNRLLVFYENFKEFSIPYPDSLSWIERPLDEP
ncbi:hypothetical protein [Chitinophaga varians]|uniref:hypothetical protein n=1 Tax=Chitinophaga varians TaxID=2202339 RepID=UPI00165F5A7C|nr:hypothetical protein [Chitinophaga varians]MBC9914955.1 hypothetical protein [Chitinophaga varians]